MFIGHLDIFFGETSVQSFAHFSIKSSVSFSMICRHSLYILGYEFFVRHMYYKYALLLSGLSFHSLILLLLN